MHRWAHAGEGGVGRKSRSWDTCRQQIHHFAYPHLCWEGRLATRLRSSPGSLSARSRRRPGLRLYVHSWGCGCNKDAFKLVGLADVNTRHVEAAGRTKRRRVPTIRSVRSSAVVCVCACVRACACARALALARLVRVCNFEIRTWTHVRSRMVTQKALSDVGGRGVCAH